MAETCPAKLASEGDSLERRWAEVILADLPDYEQLWLRHIVPLTFRGATNPESRSNFVRPGINRLLRDMADAHYATFHHLAHCHAWINHAQQQLNSTDPSGSDSNGFKHIREFPSSSEVLYCFLAHAVSVNDAMLHFVAAVNQVLLVYASREYFVFEFDNCRKSGKQVPRNLRDIPPDLQMKEYNKHVQKLKSLRNRLLHKCPVFIHNIRMPVSAQFARYSGLTGIGQLALQPENIDEHFQPMAEYLGELLHILTRLLRPIWQAALTQLDSIPPGEYHKHRSSYAPMDRKLRAADFKAIRKIGAD